MAVVPTMTLQSADGSTSQGFSTLYDFKIINPNLLVYGQVVGGFNTYMPLGQFQKTASAYDCDAYTTTAGALDLSGINTFRM